MNEKVGLTDEQKARMREAIIRAAMAELKGIKGKTVRERHSRKDRRG